MNTAKKRLLAEEQNLEAHTELNTEFNSDIALGETDSKYYFDDEAAKIAQEVYERPELRMLFSASRKVSADDLKAVIAIVERMKKEDE